MNSVWYDEQIDSAIKIVEDENMGEACAFLTQKVKDSMVPGSYRLWLSKKGDGSYHWSSKPGTPPAPDTEELKDSISFSTSGGKSGGIGSNSKVANIDQPPAIVNSVIGNVGTNEIKGLWQELGTSINPDKRPFLRPVLYGSTQEILNLLSKNKI